MPVIGRKPSLARQYFNHYDGEGDSVRIKCSARECNQVYSKRGPANRLAEHLMKCQYQSADVNIQFGADEVVRQLKKKQKDKDRAVAVDVEAEVDDNDNTQTVSSAVAVIPPTSRSSNKGSVSGPCSIFRGLEGVQLFPKSKSKSNKKSRSSVPLVLESSAKVEADNAICELFLRHDYPWVNIDSDAWDNVVNKIIAVGKGYTTPGRQKLSETLSENVYKTHRMQTDKLLAERMPERGITVSTDGATIYGEKLSNYSAMIPGEKYTVPIGIYNGKLGTLMGEGKTARANAEEVRDVVKGLPHEGIYLALLTSDTTGNMSSAWPLIEEYLPTTCCASDPMHTMSLVLDNISEQCEQVKILLRDCAEITKYMWSSVALITLIDEDTTVGTGRMKRPLKTSDIRMIKQYLVAYRIEALRKTLARIVLSGAFDAVVTRKLGKEKVGNVDWEKANRIRCMIESTSWWKRLSCMLRIVWPLVQIMRLGDSQKPTVPHIYQGMERAEKFWAKRVRGTGASLDIADSLLRNLNSDQRGNWNFLKTRPYLLAGYAFNPECISDRPVSDPKVRAAVDYVLRRTLRMDCNGNKSEEDAKFQRASRELDDFWNRVGMYAVSSDCWQDVGKMYPYQWWNRWGAWCPTARKAVIIILSRTATSCMSERFFKLYKRATPKERMKLGMVRRNQYTRTSVPDVIENDKGEYELDYGEVEGEVDGEVEAVTDVSDIETDDVQVVGSVVSTPRDDSNDIDVDDLSTHPDNVEANTSKLLVTRAAKMAFSKAVLLGKATDKKAHTTESWEDGTKCDLSLDWDDMDMTEYERWMDAVDLTGISLSQPKMIVPSVEPREKAALHTNTNKNRDMFREKYLGLILVFEMDTADGETYNTCVIDGISYVPGGVGYSCDIIPCDGQERIRNDATHRLPIDGKLWDLILEAREHTEYGTLFQNEVEWEDKPHVPVLRLGDGTSSEDSDDSDAEQFGEQCDAILAAEEDTGSALVAMDPVMERYATYVNMEKERLGQEEVDREMGVIAREEAKKKKASAKEKRDAKKRRQKEVADSQKARAKTQAGKTKRKADERLLSKKDRKKRREEASATMARVEAGLAQAREQFASPPPSPPPGPLHSVARLAQPAPQRRILAHPSMAPPPYLHAEQPRPHHQQQHYQPQQSQPQQSQPQQHDAVDLLLSMQKGDRIRDPPATQPTDAVGQHYFSQLGMNQQHPAQHPAQPLAQSNSPFTINNMFGPQNITYNNQ